MSATSPSPPRAHLGGWQHVQGVQREQPERLHQHRELIKLPGQTEDKRRREDGEQGQPLWRENL